MAPEFASIAYDFSIAVYCEPMSLVVTRKWGNRAVMLSDTMISDRNAAHPDIIPGQLKAVVVSEKLSVGYAGRKGIALNAIREVRDSIMHGVSLNSVLELLSDASCLEESATDFLVISHLEEAALYKICGGEVRGGGDYYWIGDGDAIRIIRVAFEEEVAIADLPDYVPEEEIKLHQAFAKVLEHASLPTIGGFYFHLLASALGHCYVNHAGSYAWDQVSLGVISTAEYQKFRQSGTASWEYSITSSVRRGIGLTGAYLPQPRLGFIYDPLENDSPITVRDTTLEAVSAEVSRLADLRGQVDNQQ
jgi:hypothetical protein